MGEHWPDGGPWGPMQPSHGPMEPSQGWVGLGPGPGILTYMGIPGPWGGGWGVGGVGRLGGVKLGIMERERL